MSIDLDYGDQLYHKYTNFCRKAINNAELFKNFKRHPDYTYMLEHVTPDYGRKYITQLKNDYKDILLKIDWNIIKNNDKFGDPILVDYSKELQDIVKLDSYLYSPTTLRYLYIAVDIFMKMKNNDMLNIVEIGGGYGGQCLILCLLAPLFQKNIKNYTILDLKYPILIQQKYLEKFTLPVDIYSTTIENFTMTQQIDLLISNYALSEIQESYQNIYIPVIEKSTAGYMLWNRPHIMKCLINKKAQIINEVPETNHKNRLVYY